jgi:uncharacterized protein (TIGR02588 family)
MRRNWLEWLILGGSVVVIVALVAYLTLRALAGERPPSVAVEAGVARAEASGTWLVPLLVRNDGGQVAAAVTIEATGTVAGAEETTELTVDLLPAESEREVVASFSGQPEGAVRTRVIGYELR